MTKQARLVLLRKVTNETVQLVVADDQAAALRLIESGEASPIFVWSEASAWSLQGLAKQLRLMADGLDAMATDTPAVH